MKKLALALVCFASVAFFASCQKTIEHPEPMIAVSSGENFINGTVDQPTIIDADDDDAINLKYGFHVESNAETKKELKSLKISWTYYEDGEEATYDSIIDLTGKTTYDFSDYLFDQDRGTITLYEGTIKAVVTDVNDQTNNATIAFRVQYEEEALDIYELEWVRNGSQVDAATEAQMAALGLKWTSSYKDEVFATIEPLNEDVIVYLCDGDDFDDIIFWSDVNNYFSDLAETGEPIQKYRNITTNNSADYNDMLAVVNGDELNLIRINHAEIKSQSSGTKITISCELK